MAERRIPIYFCLIQRLLYPILIFGMDIIPRACLTLSTADWSQHPSAYRFATLYEFEIKNLAQLTDAHEKC